MKDYYQVLGVPPNASPAEIKQAYRDLIKKFHPDVNPTASAGDRSKELNEAWAVLSDPQARMSYDIDLNIPVSKRGDSASWQSPAKSRPPGASPGNKPGFCCEECGRSDATLRASINGRAYTFINFSRKPPVTRILCARCRAKEPLGANPVNVFFGWWKRKV